MQNNRYLHENIESWLKKRMVFIGGPRQVGKTYLSKQFISNSEAYLNWDSNADREMIRKGQLPINQNLLILDEIHKFSKWRNLLKGLWDKNKEHLNFIVTGSARLDLFRKGGDSLFGRYHYLRLHPFSLPEAEQFQIKDPLTALLSFGGFPEPLFEQSEGFSKIWRRERKAKVLQQDLRDLTRLKDYTELELLADALPARVGSLLSYNSLAQDLDKSPHTIEKWIEVLESVYYCYTILPFGSEKIKAVKKSKKLYLWDWSEIEENGNRFENFVASHLLKFCHYIEDTQGDRMELRFLRSDTGKEIDFIIIKNKKPIFAVECKVSAKSLSSNVEFFMKKFNIPKFYQVHLEKDKWARGNQIVLPFEEFCRIENLV